MLVISNKKLRELKNEKQIVNNIKIIIGYRFKISNIGASLYL